MSMADGAYVFLVVAALLFSFKHNTNLFLFSCISFLLLMSSHHMLQKRGYLPLQSVFAMPLLTCIAANHCHG
jgi:hypothetical protein